MLDQGISFTRPKADVGTVDWLAFVLADAFWTGVAFGCSAFNVPESEEFAREKAERDWPLFREQAEGLLLADVEKGAGG